MSPTFARMRSRNSENDIHYRRPCIIGITISRFIIKPVFIEECNTISKHWARPELGSVLARFDGVMPIFFITKSKF